MRARPERSCSMARSPISSVTRPGAWATAEPSAV